MDRNPTVLWERVRRVFSQNRVVREDAFEALQEAWGTDQASFKMEELAAMPAENCTIAAARRDGQKEVVAWIIALSKKTSPTGENE